MSTTITPAILDLLRFTRTHQRHHEALMRATGGHFNLFQILGIGHYEVRTHSPILAELLNPHGKHGQGDVFLKLFLARLEIPGGGFDAKSTRVVSEYYIGPVRDTTGGRIDIMIEDTADRPRREGDVRRILIENKIYAGDQENQLLRYHNYDKAAVLIYLTLSGKEANEFSAKNLKPDDYIKISYEKEIRDWLMNCRKEAACLPGVREMLSQYIQLIEELTHQSTTMEMNQNLIEEILRTPESLQAFYTLRDADGPVHTELMARLDADLAKYSKSIGLEKVGTLREANAKDGSFCFKSTALTQNNLVIGFQFLSSGYNGMYFGFCKIDPELPCPVADRVRVAFEKSFSSEPPTPWWPAWTNFEEIYRCWRHEAYEGIRSGQFAENLKAKLHILSVIAKDVCEGESVQIVNSTSPVS